jgi:hypothetical protein
MAIRHHCAQDCAQALVRDLRLNNIPIRPLNPPIWGTSEQLKVPQIGGFRGRLEICHGSLAGFCSPGSGRMDRVNSTY